MLMFISDDSNWDPTKPETQAAYKRIGEWFEEHTKSGTITGGEELKATNTATTVRQRNGKITVTDGPVRRIQGSDRRLRARGREGPRRGGRHGEDLAGAQRHRDPSPGDARRPFCSSGAVTV
jgi:hypothetical protein